MERASRPGVFEAEWAIRNRRNRAVLMRILPSNEKISVAAGETLRVVARGPIGGDLEVAWKGDECAIYAWPGSAIRVVRKGTVLAEAPTAPRLPAGMSTREWCEEMNRLDV